MKPAAPLLKRPDTRLVARFLAKCEAAKKTRRGLTGKRGARA